MKSQLDLIIAGVAFVLALVLAGVFWGTKRVVTPKPAPTAIVTTPAVYPASDVVYGTNLPGGSGGGPAAGGGGAAAPAAAAPGASRTGAGGPPPGFVPGGGGGRGGARG